MYNTQAVIYYLPAKTQKIMKQKIVAILALIALSCQKEKVSEQQTALTAKAESAATTAQLLNDSNFVKLYQISLPVFNDLRFGRNDLIELSNDGLVYSIECPTLAPKLGFKDSAALVKYFRQVDKLAPKIAKAHPNMTLEQCQAAVAQLNANDFGSTSCQDAAEGQFMMNVAQCAALGLIPVVGEVLAGTCMVGALMTYNAAMQQCAGGVS